MFKNYTKTMFILVGIQASGKTTFCKTFFPDTATVSLDALKTRKKEDNALREILRRQTNCVVDNTNPTRAERQKYIMLAKTEHYKTVGIYFSSKLEECIPRNNQRAGKAQVPLKALLATAKKLEIPAYEEGLDELYYVTITGRNFSITEWNDKL